MMACLLPDIGADLFRALQVMDQQMAWAEDELSRATKRHPAEGDALYHAFRLLRPHHDLMATEFVYRSHCREILERVAHQEDTRPGTAAEVCCLCHDASQVAPLTTPAAGLYFRMWAVAFPDNPAHGGVDNLSHYEALEGPAIDDLETTARRKLTIPDRKLWA